MGMTLTFWDRTKPSTSLVADPRDLRIQIAEVHAEPDVTARTGGERLVSARLVRAWMERYSKRLHSKFFARDLIDRKQYTIWIVAAIGVLFGIWIVAGLGFMSTITAVSSGFLPATLARAVIPPLYVGLLAVMAGAFIAILFVVHRARRPESRDVESGFAGFAWNGDDGRDEYLGFQRSRVRGGQGRRP